VKSVSYALDEYVVVQFKLHHYRQVQGLSRFLRSCYDEFGRKVSSEFLLAVY